jgi:tRNA(Ile)-lysidine synthase
MTLFLHDSMAGFAPALPLGVAYSGGADSTALLVLCARQWPGQVVALHVNHGLQTAAADFEAHCRQQCAALGVPLHTRAVNAHAQAGQSPEDAARTARYTALTALAHAAGLHSVALAQHADDQVETLLLALSRGAGPAGLSAMPAQWTRSGLQFYRPLLQVAGAHIRTWLTQQGIGWVQDPTNTDEAYTRNRIRAQVLPALQVALPQFRDTFARSAAHSAQAQQLLDELAQQDLQQVLRPEDGLPLIAALQALSPARQGNALRHWLKSGYQTLPSAAQLAELQRQIAACRTRGHRIELKVGAGVLERRGAVLAWYNPQVLLQKN